MSEVKRIRVTIEWIGSCSEETWAAVCSETIEGFHGHGLVTGVEILTHHGPTPEKCESELRRWQKKTRRSLKNHEWMKRSSVTTP